MKKLSELVAFSIISPHNGQTLSELVAFSIISPHNGQTRTV